MRRRVEFK
jgi:S15_bact: ribosomal protein S15